MRPAFSLARAGPAPPSAVGDGGGSSSSKKKDGSGGGSTIKNLPRLHRLPSRAAGLAASPEPSKEASSASASSSAVQQQPVAEAAAASASRSAAAFAYAQGLFSRFRGNESVSREEKRKKQGERWRKTSPDRAPSGLLFALFAAQQRAAGRVPFHRAGERVAERASEAPACVPFLL